MRRLATRFRAVVLSLGPIAVAACSAAATELEGSAPCISMAPSSRYALLTPASNVDGIVFWAAAGARSMEGQPVAEPTELSRAGAPCRSASSEAECLARIESAARDAAATGWESSVDFSGRGGSDFKHFAIVTRGDDVRLVTTVDELRTLVAPIETIEEAVVVYQLDQQPLACEPHNAEADRDGWRFRYVSRSCGGREVEEITRVRRSGEVVRVSETELSKAKFGCIEGRRPIGMDARDTPWLSTLSNHLEAIATMEAAAVVAFDELAGQLAVAGAPDTLIRRVRVAERDEIGHAHRMEELAARVGRAATRPIIATAASPTFVELAVHNSVEGCVRETYGALIAMHQAVHASDPALRAAFEQIAEEEARHAELSADLAAWFDTKLDVRERLEVRRARDAAIATLRRTCCEEPSAEVARDAGMPTAKRARRLLEAMETMLLAS